MARYAETLKNRVVAKLLPPESASVSAIAKEVGVTVQTLERWRDGLSIFTFLISALFL